MSTPATDTSVRNSIVVEAPIERALSVSGDGGWGRCLRRFAEQVAA